MVIGLLDAPCHRRTGERLYAQWSLFWDTSKPVLLEKTPENLFMGPYLQASFGAPSTRFVFVMRHPLIWALAIEKWIFADFVKLRTVEDRIAFWFDTMTRAIESMPQLHDAMLIQLESASASIDMQLGIARHLLCSGDRDGNRSHGATVRLDADETREILSSSIAT